MFGRIQDLRVLRWRYLVILWPLVLLSPHLPGIPRPAVDGLPWRQELSLSLLLTVTLLCLVLPRTRIGPSYERLKENAISVALLALFVCWTLLSVFWASDHYQAMHLAMQWSCYLVFFVLLLVMPARTIRRSIPILTVVVWILVISSVLETWLGAPVTDGSLRVGVKPILRASGTFGELMGVCSVLFAGCSLSVRRVRHAVILGVTSVGCCLATLQSLERAPFIATAIGLFVLLTVAALNREQRRKRVVVITIALFAVFVSQSLPATASNEGLSTVGRLQQSLQNDSNTHARLLLWAVGFEMLKAHPLTGVGGGNYQVNYDDALAKFAYEHSDSSLVELNDHLLPIYAHNEYVQMLAELGVIGFLLFAGFVLTLVVQCFRKVRSSANRLTTVAAATAILAFLLSSGASASSFRSVGGGLLFFFAAAIILRSKRDQISRTPRTEKRAQGFARLLTAATAAMFIFFAIQASGTVLLALAEQSGPIRAERYYRSALRIYPASSAVNFSYGMWLYSNNRFTESVPRLEKALAAGLNSSICYEYLAAAQDAAGDSAGAERTLGQAVKTYPRSVFLLTRHAVALDRLGRHSEATQEIEQAMTIDARACRGWQQLLVHDIDAAFAAATRESDIALPGELLPQAAVFAVLRENEIRNPNLAQEGWRKRIKSVVYSASRKR